MKATGNNFLSLFQFRIIVGNVYCQFSHFSDFLLCQKNTIDLVLEICSCLKYESIVHKIHLKETGNRLLSLFQF